MPNRLIASPSPLLRASTGASSLTGFAPYAAPQFPLRETVRDGQSRSIATLLRELRTGQFMKTRHKLALARLGYLSVKTLRRALGRPMQGEFSRRQIRWSLDLNEAVDFMIYLLGAFEPLTVRACQQLIRENDTVLDIGANVGALSLFFAQSVGTNGKVVGFEPTAFAFGKLQKNLALNPALAARVETHQMMLTATGAEALPDSICSSWPLTGGQDLHAKHGGAAQGLAGARAGTLDDFVAQRPGLKPNWIKIDVDGNELTVFRGAANVLREFRPSIVMELSPYQSRESGNSFAELVDLLRNAGYGFRKLESRAVLPDDAASLERLVPDGASMNVLLEHRAR